MQILPEAAHFLEAVRSRNLPEARARASSLGRCAVNGDNAVTLLQEAATAGPEYVEALTASGLSLEARDSENNTALLRACETGNVAAARSLLAQKAVPDVFRGSVVNALYLAVSTRSPRHLEIVKALIGAGADVNILSRSRFGDATSSPLMEASRVGNIEAVTELLAAGAQVNLLLTSGTALIRAAREGHEELVKLLLRAGADVNARVADNPRYKRSAGKTAAELAGICGHSRVVQLLSPQSSATVGEAPVDLATTWTMLEGVLLRKRKSAYEALEAGATQEKVLALSAAIGVRLPATAEQFFRRHDGQSDVPGAAFIRGGPALFNEFRFLPISEAIREWRLWRELAARGEFEGCRVIADRGVRPDWCNPGWIPLTSDGLGNSHCLDLSPAPEGRLGQIILMWHDLEERPRVAESLGSWLQSTANDLELLPGVVS